MTTTNSTYRERPVAFTAGDEELFGILTQPVGEANGLTIVHLNGKGPSASTVGRGRISVFLTRALAGRGFHGFRLDWAGTGESTGEAKQWDLTELPVEELRGAVDALRALGLDRVVIVGTCGGARAGLEAAARTEGVAGVALLNMPVRDYDRDKRYESMATRDLVRRLMRRQTLRDMKDSRRRSRYVSRAKRKMRQALKRLTGGEPADTKSEAVGPGLLAALNRLVDDGVPVLVFYGSDDDDYRDWVAASEGRLGEVVARSKGRIAVEVVSGRYYDRSSRQLTAELVDAIESHLGPN